MKKATFGMVIAGGMLIISGFLGVAVSLGQSTYGSLRIGATFVIALGALGVAIPLYTEARRVRAECHHAARGAGFQPNLSPCALCGAKPATFRCATHLVRVCADCVPRHDDPLRCIYKNLVIAPAPAAAQRVLIFPNRVEQAFKLQKLEKFAWADNLRGPEYSEGKQQS